MNFGGSVVPFISILKDMPQSCPPPFELLSLYSLDLL
jgi:hypothetical protein